VTGGQLKGRRLASPPEGVRPTADRVRESLFAKLGDLEGLHVLDLYAGTGALGIEAVSRGASSVVCVDQSERSLATLRRNLRDLALEECITTQRGDARAVLRRLEKRGCVFDLVFLDPPYEADVLPGALAALVEGRLLAEGAVVVAESSKRHALGPIAGLCVSDERLYGDTRITWLARDDVANPTTEAACNDEAG
jgi:16S rRNA (guanine966-N2)-methyltransferase